MRKPCTVGLLFASVTLRLLALPLIIVAGVILGVELAEVTDRARGGERAANVLIEEGDALLVAVALLMLASLLVGVAVVAGGVRRLLIALHPEPDRHGAATSRPV